MGACPPPLRGDRPLRACGDVERGGAGWRTAQRPGGCPPGVLPCSPLPQLWASAVMVLGWVHRCILKTRGPRRAWFWLLFSGHAFIDSVESFSLQTGIGGQITGALPGFASFQQTLVWVSGFGGEPLLSPAGRPSPSLVPSPTPITGVHSERGTWEGQRCCCVGDRC